MSDLTLTFDNGPEPSVTPLVLDVLARHGVVSTFFVIGCKLLDPTARACAERAHAEGHWIGNHTWTHSRPLGEQLVAHVLVRGAEAVQLAPLTTHHSPLTFMKCHTAAPACREDAGSSAGENQTRAI